MEMESMTSQREGQVARSIERETSKLPSDLFLWSGVGAIVTSLTLQLFGKKQTSNFVATWVPTVLLLGLYNKIVKVAGHDRFDRQVD
jgi:membrane protein implicated in regulation of membrane protease activity